jgi:hypothetical protein
MTDEIDSRLTRVSYRRATDQMTWFTAGHMLRKLEVEFRDIGAERRFVFKIEGDAMPGEIEPPNEIRDWIDLAVREPITLREARQLGKWLRARTAPRLIRLIREQLLNLDWWRSRFPLPDPFSGEPARPLLARVIAEKIANPIGNRLSRARKRPCSGGW